MIREVNEDEYEQLMSLIVSCTKQAYRNIRAKPKNCGKGL